VVDAAHLVLAAFPTRRSSDLSFAIMREHVLPNVLGPVLVIATINLALAIIEEATLSYLGAGVPPTQPSLGTLIRIGQQFLFSGRSEEHTSELQSRENLVCRLL